MLHSNALHFWADLIATLAVVVGLILVAAGYRNAEAIAALFVALLIFAAAGRRMLKNLRSSRLRHSESTV